MSMAAPAVAALQQNLLLHPKLNICFTRKSFLKSRHRRLVLASLSSSSSPTPPETQTETAESCVNLGLSFFSKGRVREFSDG